VLVMNCDSCSNIAFFEAIVKGRVPGSPREHHDEELSADETLHLLKHYLEGDG
jgi:hypothetical protein